MTWLTLMYLALNPVAAPAATAAGLSTLEQWAIGIGIGLLLSLGGLVYNIGRKMGAVAEKMTSYEAAVKLSDAAGEQYSRDVVAAIKEFEGKITDVIARVAELEHKWRDSHDMTGRVQELEGWRREVDQRCRDRLQRTLSGRLVDAPEDGAPVDAFDAFPDEGDPSEGRKR